MILVPAARGNKEVGFSKPHGDKFALLSRSQHPFIVYSVKLCTKMSRACLFWRNSGIINDFRPPQTVSGHCGRDHSIFHTMVTESYRNLQKCYLIRNYSKPISFVNTEHIQSDDSLSSQEGRPVRMAIFACEEVHDRGCTIA